MPSPPVTPSAIPTAARVAWGFRLGLVVSVVLALGLYAVWMIGPGRPADLFLSWAVNACACAWLWALCEVVAGRGGKLRNALATLVFYPVIYFLFASCFVHTFFFDAAAERRVSLLDLNLGAVAFFFFRVLPPKGWAALTLLTTAIHAGAQLTRRNTRSASSPQFLGALLGFTLLTSTVAANAARIPSPLVDIAHDFWELGTLPRIVPAARAAYPLDTLDKSAAAPTLRSTPFKKVLVFVMETMTQQKLTAEIAGLSPNSFLVRERAHLHHYTRYTTNNQDSRTGMLDMLSSRLIPYEAYTEAGRDHYAFLADKPSLVDRFHDLGFQTAYGLSQVDVEIVVGDMPWTKVLHLEEQQVRSDPRNLCFVTFQFEHGCEDRALLPQVFDFIDSSERAFLYQEFIWGHAIEYNQASGKTNTQYYSSYLDAVVAHLKEKGLLDDTLIVLTSDHGFRDKGKQSDPDVFHIPLLFFSTRFTEQSDERLFSHSDLKDLLFHELGADDMLVEDPFVMVVGPTSSAMTAVLTKNDDFMLWKQRGNAHFLVRYQNVRAPSTRVDPAQPGAFLKLFDDYRRHFDASR